MAVEREGEEEDSPPGAKEDASSPPGRGESIYLIKFKFYGKCTVTLY